jgi:hypothetical protein
MRKKSNIELLSGDEVTNQSKKLFFYLDNTFSISPRSRLTSPSNHSSSRRQVALEYAAEVHWLKYLL